MGGRGSLGDGGWVGDGVRAGLRRSWMGGGGLGCGVV